MTTAIAAELFTPLPALAEEIHTRWQATRRNQIAAWDGYLDVGDLLTEARSRFAGDREYGQWFKEQDFGFSTQWAGRLRQMAAERPAVTALLETAVSSGLAAPGVNALLQTLHPPQAQSEPVTTARPITAYEPDHKRSAVVEIIVNYPFGVTKRETGSAHGSGAERREWHCELVMATPIPDSAFAVDAFAVELANRFKSVVLRERKFDTMQR